jgi:hypothetical protein
MFLVCISYAFQEDVIAKDARKEMTGKGRKTKENDGSVTRNNTYPFYVYCADEQTQGLVHLYMLGKHFTTK